MIKSFKDKETEKIFNGIISKKYPTDLHKRALVRLLDIHKATNIKDLLIPPSNKLEKLQGDRKDQYSIRVNQQYRICFYWNEETIEATEVEIIDYH
jgi:proteic killer suppression protein